MNFISLYKDSSLVEEYEDRDMPEIAGILARGENLDVYIKFNFPTKNLGLYLTQTSSNADFRYPIDIGNASSRIHLLNMNTLENPSDGLSVCRVIDVFGEVETQFKFFNNENGSTSDNRIILGVENYKYNAGESMHLRFKFKASSTVAPNKRLFIGVESFGELVPESDED